MNKSKNYLMQLWYIDKDIQSRITERDNILTTQISGIDYSKDNVQETEKIYDNRYTKYIELGEEIDKKIDELVELKSKVTKQIDKLEDRLSMIILRERYINMRSWSEITVILNKKDVRQVHYLHKTALDQFDEILLYKYH